MRPIRCVYSRTNYSNAVCWNNTQTIVSFWMAKQWSPFLSFHFFAIVRRWEIILNKTEFWSSRYDFFVVTTQNWQTSISTGIYFCTNRCAFCVCVCVCAIWSGRQINSRLLFKYFGFEATTVVQKFWMRSKTFVHIIRNQTETFFANIFGNTSINLFKQKEESHSLESLTSACPKIVPHMRMTGGSTWSGFQMKKRLRFLCKTSMG